MSDELRDISVDSKARAEALDVTRSFLVQAPAGSGKTELLIRRYLALLATAERPEQIVAITFTRKAAAEMLGRILDALNSACGERCEDEHKRQTQELARAVLQRDERQSWGLLRNPGRLRVETIDALCGEIVRSSPLAAGVVGTIEEDARPRYEEAARRAVRELASDDAATSNALRCLLLHLDGELDTLHHLIAEMLQKRDQWRRYLPNDGDPADLRERLEQALHSTVSRMLREVRNAMPRKHKKELLRLAKFAGGHARNNEALAAWMDFHDLPGTEPDDRDAWLALRALLLKSDGDWRTSVDRRNGFPAEWSKEKQAMESLLAQLNGEERLSQALGDLRKLPPNSYDDAQWEVAQALFRVLPASVAHLRDVFAEYGVCDFGEVAAGALAALRASTHDHGVRHLMVDEYQDTSVTQQELLEQLIRDWRDGEGRTIFLVGDPMQSIYAFRQAEVGLFLKAQQSGCIGKLPLTALRLERNFRSSATVVKWVNTAFEQIFTREQDANKGAVSYAPMAEAQPAGPKVEVHAFLETAAGPSSAQSEAERVGQIIQQTRMRTPEAKVAILVSARAHLHAIVPELVKRGLRFRGVEIQPLAEVQVVRDLQSLTRALLHPADRIAWLALLRGPWCGLGLRDLQLLCGDFDERRACVPELVSRKSSQLSQPGQQRLARLKRVMAAAEQQRGRMPLSQLIEGTWLALGGPACVNAAQVEDAATYFRALAALEHAGDIASLSALEERLGQLFAAPDPLADGRLQIMTIHKAKGLEFDVVIVPQLARRAPDDDESLLLWHEHAGEEAPELLLAPLEGKGEDDDALYGYLAHVQRERRREETKRVLYVACTRAKTSLHLMGAAQLDRNGDVKRPNKTSLLAYLWPVVERDFQKAAQSAAPQQPQLFQIAAGALGATLHRLRLDWQLPAAPPTVQGAQPLPRSAEAKAEITFEWASDLRRQVGTVIHEFLQRIAREGLEHWSAGGIADEREVIMAALRSAGVAEANAAQALEEVEHALRNTLADPRGRWCLAQHEECETEAGVSGMLHGGLHHIRIDRTFVHEGTRWIIDYKTGTREGSGLEAFLDNEARRYREQLATYAELFRQIDGRPLRIGLYFPANGGWREWAPLTEDAAGAGA